MKFLNTHYEAQLKLDDTLSPTLFAHLSDLKQGYTQRISNYQLGANMGNLIAQIIQQAMDDLSIIYENSTDIEFLNNSRPLVTQIQSDIRAYFPLILNKIDLNEYPAVVKHLAKGIKNIGTVQQPQYVYVIELSSKTNQAIIRLKHLIESKRFPTNTEMLDALLLFIDDANEQLIIQTKKLFKLSFFFDKTVSGIIIVGVHMLKQYLKKVAPKISPQTGLKITQYCLTYIKQS